MELLIIIGIILIIVLIVRGKSGGESHTASGRTTSGRTAPSNRYHSTPVRTGSDRTITRQNFRQKLDTLSDADDVRRGNTAQNRRMSDTARQYNRSRQRTISTTGSRQTIRIDLSWAENLAELLDITEVVYSNVDLNCQKPLAIQRFYYYTRLHYRSFTAADLCHAKQEEIGHCIDNVNQLLNQLSDRSDPMRVSREDFDQLKALRNSMNTIRKFLCDRRDALNRQTAVIRDKIGRECGEKGKMWYAEIMKNKS